MLTKDYMKTMQIHVDTSESFHCKAPDTVIWFCRCRLRDADSSDFENYQSSESQGGHVQV